MTRKLKDDVEDILFELTFVEPFYIALVLFALLMIFTLAVTDKGEEADTKPNTEQTVESEPVLVEPVPVEPVICEAVSVEEPEIDWTVQEQMAVGIYREGGGDMVCDDCRIRIGDVMLNRVADPRFPDTLEEVLTQKGQYGRMHWEGITFPARAAQPEEFHAVQRAYDTAEAILTGTHSELYGQGYIYQSEFPDLGHDAFEHCGIYFAKG